MRAWRRGARPRRVWPNGRGSFCTRRKARRTRTSVCGWTLWVAGLYDEPRPDAPRRSATTSPRSFSRPLRRRRGTQRTGAVLDGEGRRVCANRQFIGSGRPSIFSPIAPRRSSFPPTLYLSRRRAILSAFSLRNARSFRVSLRRARLRRWIDPSRCFPCARDKSSGAPTTIRHGAFLFTALDAATGEVIERSLSASSRTRVPELPARDRAPCPARTRSAPDHEQRRHPQDADDPKVARRATEIACPLHPTASSWVNPVERFLADITEKQIRRDVHHSTEELETAIDRGSRRQSKTLPGPNPPTISSPTSSASSSNRSKSPQPKPKSHETQNQDANLVCWGSRRYPSSSAHSPSL